MVWFRITVELPWMHTSATFYIREDLVIVSPRQVSSCDSPAAQVRSVNCLRIFKVETRSCDRQLSTLIGWFDNV